MKGSKAKSHASFYCAEKSKIITGGTMQKFTKKDDLIKYLIKEVLPDKIHRELITYRIL